MRNKQNNFSTFNSTRSINLCCSVQIFFINMRAMSWCIRVGSFKVLVIKVSHNLLSYFIEVYFDHLYSGQNGPDLSIHKTNWARTILACLIHNVPFQQKHSKQVQTLTLTQQMHIYTNNILFLCTSTYHTDFINLKLSLN